MNSIVLDKKVEQICLSVGVLTAAIVLFKSTSFVFSNKSKNEIPLVPYKIPFVGSTMAYYKNTLEFTKKYSEKYGSVFRMHLHGQIVTVVGADDAPEVFTHPDLSFLAAQVEVMIQKAA
ncbi:hypothetical protein G6F35_016415 [Rhizopus arrhizus]|nr:hypothetical protein G6F35_016415 [Rhizopus arrhizus]